MEPIVRVSGVHKHFRRGSEIVDVLKDLCLEVPEGEFLGLMGPSGSGTTPRLHLIAGARDTWGSSSSSTISCPS